MTGYLKYWAKKIFSKFYFSPKQLFGKFVDDLDGGSYQQETRTEINEQRNYQKHTFDRSKLGSVPFMITRNMKMDLMDMGYSMKDIKNMTPLEAHQILQKKD